MRGTGVSLLILKLTINIDRPDSKFEVQML